MSGQIPIERGLQADELNNPAYPARSSRALSDYHQALGKHRFPDADRIKSNSIIVLAGPAVELKFENHRVVESSHLMSHSGYEFTEMGVTTQFERSDLDLSIGREFNRTIA